MNTFWILKGTHRAFPPTVATLTPKPNTDIIVNEVYDMRKMAYNLKTEDQLDWCKLSGFSQNFVDRHENTIMVGFRYLPESDEFEYNYYSHIDGKVDYTEPIVRMKRTEFVPLRYRLTKMNEGVEIIATIAGSGLFSSIVIPSSKVWFIDTWFGGNRSAPKSLSFRRSRTIDRSPYKMADINEYTLFHKLAF